MLWDCFYSAFLQIRLLLNWFYGHLLFGLEEYKWQVFTTFLSFLYSIIGLYYYDVHTVPCVALEMSQTTYQPSFCTFLPLVAPLQFSSPVNTRFSEGYTDWNTGSRQSHTLSSPHGSTKDTRILVEVHLWRGVLSHKLSTCPYIWTSHKRLEPLEEDNWIDRWIERKKER